MNAERLLALYDDVAHAPNAIPLLRRFVLDLAVRGKLVDQYPTDEPASELLKRIASGKAALKRETGDRRIKQTSDPNIDDYPVPLPATWQVQCFDNLFLFIDYRGKTPPKTSDGIPLITAKNVRFGVLNREPREFIDETTYSIWMTRGLPKIGDLFFTTEAPLGNVCQNDIAEPFALAQRVICLRPFGEVDTRYIMYAIMSNVSQTLIGKHSTGLTAKGIKSAKLKLLPIPVPPIEEQHRIVARVDELMAFCNQLNYSQTACEKTRDRLTQASYARLNISDTDDATFQSHTRFVVDALPALTARADQVKHLRQTILSLAVEGKLVEQDPADEPASELLKRIAGEKSRLKVRHHVKPFSTGELPFSLPVGWIWSRLGELCTKTGSGSTPRGGKKVYKQVGVPFLRSQNVYDDGLRLDDVAYISPDVHVRMAGTAVRSRDILLNITGGSMGRCCRVPDKFGEANVSQHVSIIRSAVSEMADFLQKLVLSPYFQAFIFDEQTGAGRGGLPKYKMDRIPVAVPPLAEQRRIAAKVDELMTLCDRLEASLASVDMRRVCMLESFLREALEPRANDPENSDSSEVPMGRGLFLLRGKKTCRVRNEGLSLSPT